MAGKESEMKTINNSLGKPNWSQRMNPDDPSTSWNETLETCNVTAAITAIATAGYDVGKLNKGFHARPPMDLLYFMRKDPDCVSLHKKLDPNHANPMNEWMDVLALAIGKYIGFPSPLKVQYGASLAKLLIAIVRGEGIVIHGHYTFMWPSGKTTTGGHFQSLAGMSYVVKKGDAELGGTMLDDNKTVEKLVLSGLGYEIEPKSFIVDDPFGNSKTSYIETAGNDIEYSADYFKANVKPLGAFSKDMIVIPKAT